MNSNIVTVVFPDLDPVNQLGDHQMLGFVAGMGSISRSTPSRKSGTRDWVQPLPQS